MSFDRGYSSPYFVTDQERQICELENPKILITDQKISTLANLVPILEEVQKSASPFLILAEDIGSIISKAMDIVTSDGVITVEESQSLDTELDITEGMSFDRGYSSPYFVTDQERQICELENPKILILSLIHI